RELGLSFESDEGDRPQEGRLTGSQYVITGTLESFTREEATAALEALGAKVSDSVSKKTTGVFVGENPGSKVAKAEKAGVPVLGRTGTTCSRARRRAPAPGARSRSSRRRSAARRRGRSRGRRGGTSAASQARIRSRGRSAGRARRRRRGTPGRPG